MLSECLSYSGQCLAGSQADCALKGKIVICAVKSLFMRLIVENLNTIFEWIASCFWFSQKFKYSLPQMEQKHFSVFIECVFCVTGERWMLTQICYKHLVKLLQFKNVERKLKFETFLTNKVDKNFCHRLAEPACVSNLYWRWLFLKVQNDIFSCKFPTLFVIY